MNFLILCTKFPLGENDSYLTTELADSLVRQGHQVCVVVTDWNAPFNTHSRRHVTSSGVDVLVVAPRGIQRLGKLIERISKWSLSSLGARSEMAKAFGANRFDAILAFTPCVTVAGQLIWARGHFGCPSMLFVHDFFPFHHRSIGLLPAAIFPIALLGEQYLLKGFDVIGCMSESNIAYLNANYTVRSQQKVALTPLWTNISRPTRVDPAIARARYGLPIDKQIVVFGGQMTQGRGVEDMLRVSDLAARSAPELAFLFIGDGRLAHLAIERARGEDSNVYYLKRVPREQYLQLISACNVGVVATVPGVKSASFPSKILDYLRANLPIVAALEKDNELHSLLPEWRVGRAVDVGDVDALHSAIVQQIMEGPTAASLLQRTEMCLRSIFDVELAAQRVTKHMQLKTEL